MFFHPNKLFKETESSPGEENGIQHKLDKVGNLVYNKQ